MKKQFKRFISRFLVCIFLSNVVIVPESQAMEIPAALIAVEVTTEMLLAASSCIAGIVAILGNKGSRLPESSSTGKIDTIPSSVLLPEVVGCASIAPEVGVTGLCGVDEREERVGIEADCVGNSQSVGAPTGKELIIPTAIANQVFFELAQAKVTGEIPLLIITVPALPKSFAYIPLPNGGRWQPVEGQGPCFAYQYTNSSAEGDARFYRCLDLQKMFKMQHRLRHDSGYKAKIVAQSQDVLDCLLRIYEGSLEEKIVACNELQSLHIEGMLNGILVDIAGQVRNKYFHSDGSPSVKKLIDQEVAADFVRKFVKAIERNTGRAIKKSELMSSTLYEQIRHYKKPRQLAHDLSLCRKACRKYNFEKAEQFLAKYGEESIFHDMIDLYRVKQLKEFQAALYDADGIVSVAHNDPAYLANRVALIGATAEQKEVINKNLLIRHYLKEVMHKKWGISKKAPKCVQEAMYGIMGTDGAALADISLLQSRIEDIIKAAPANRRATLIDAFYLSNGILKEYAQHFADVKNIKIPKKILSPTCSTLRHKLNNLMCEWAKSPSKRGKIRSAIEFLSEWLKAKNNKDVIQDKAKFERAYINVFNSCSVGASTHVESAAVSPKVIPENGGFPAVEIPIEVPAHTAAPDQVVPEEVIDVQTSMPMPPTPQGPELEPEKELKPAELKSSVSEGEVKVPKNQRGVISLSEYDTSLGDLKKLEEAANIFKDNPSAIAKDGPLTKLLETGKIGYPESKLATARGAAYELEKACDLAKSGEEVIGFGRKIGGKEFDIETINKLIECKNIDWSKASIEKISNLKGTLGSQLEIAKNAGKDYIFCSKQNIPKLLEEWLIKKEISFFVG